MREEGFSVILALVLALIAVISIVGNISIMIVMSRDIQIRKMTIYPFLIAIATTDLMFGLIPLTLNIIESDAIKSKIVSDRLVA